mmetsp:Transcript_45975/g.68417  ORF Transcript_45975/g.68417 Transcript_45975/m.68417 type:complete len:97 (-) Transcript_45975:19-309(-)
MTGANIAGAAMILVPTRQEEREVGWKLSFDKVVAECGSMSFMSSVVVDDDGVIVINIVSVHDSSVGSKSRGDMLVSIEILWLVVFFAWLVIRVLQL